MKIALWVKGKSITRSCDAFSSLQPRLGQWINVSLFCNLVFLRICSWPDEGRTKVTIFSTVIVGILDILFTPKWDSKKIQEMPRANRRYIPGYV